MNRRAILATSRQWSSDGLPAMNCQPTYLRCPDCSSVPVNRIIEGDTFVPGNTRVILYGMDTSEIGEDCAIEPTYSVTKYKGPDQQLQIRLGNSEFQHDFALQVNDLQSGLFCRVGGAGALPDI